MHILLVYATNSGGTYEAAKAIAAVLSGAGHAVAMQRANDVTPQDFSGRDCVILGSCTWEKFEGATRLEGQLQQHMDALLADAKHMSFPRQRFAVFGLGDSSYTDFCAAADHLEAFVSAVQGKLVVPSLRIDGFFYDLEKHRSRVGRWAHDLAGALGA